MLLAALAVGNGFLLIRSKLEIARTLQAISDLHMDTNALIASGRMLCIENDYYTKVHSL